MEQDKNVVYLKHIRDAILKIEEYAGRGGRAFDKDTAIQDGIVRQLEIIGEAARKISHKYADENDALPWREMVGMRDRLIHDYMGVDLDVVWETVVGDLPGLKVEIEGLLGEVEEGERGS